MKNFTSFSMNRDRLACEYIEKEQVDPALYQGSKKLVWVGDKKKYCMPGLWMEQGEGFYNFKTRPDDVWIVTNTRSGKS